MGFLSVIRRWALRDKMPIREIARRTGLSRNTIKKYLREDAVDPRFKIPHARVNPVVRPATARLVPDRCRAFGLKILQQPVNLSATQSQNIRR